MPNDKPKIPIDAPHNVIPVEKQTGRVPIGPTRDFTSVGMQQGRVPLDPDSNEQGAIDGRPPRFEKKTLDIKSTDRPDGK
jgi:hypothetical protein